MNVFGQMIKARLENIAGAVASVKKGFIYFSTDTDRPIVDDGTDVSEIAMRKHLATIFDEDQLHRITKADTKENLDALTRSLGKLYYATDDEKLYFDNGTDLVLAGSGSGVGGINYIKTFDFQSTNGWATYKDAVLDASEDGIGGTAAALSIAASTDASYRLRGGKSLVVAKADTLNGQGEGFSTDIKIDPADKGSLQLIEFDKNTTDLNYDSGDFIVEVYDITNGAKLNVSNSKIPAGKGKHFATFQASPTSVDFRIIIHCATDKTSPITISFDNFLCGPNVFNKVTPFGQVGQLVEWPADKAPDGPLLYCDGSEVSRTVYADLFELIGETYGAGDGATTFNVPDYRGYFRRAMDDSAGVDPDSGVRTDRGDGVGGDAVGTKQDMMYQSHTHQLWSNNGAAGDARGIGNSSASYGVSGVLNGSGGQGYFLKDRANTGTQLISNAGGGETRPKNINVKIYIVYESLYKASRYIENINGDVGRIESFAGDLIPNGTLYTDGSWVQKQDYRELYDVVGDKWLNGESPRADEFRLPDLRDMFIRGDHASRDVGTYQEDDFKSHRHLQFGNQGAYNSYSGGQTGQASEPAENQWTDYTGGTETRPKNFAVKYVIRFRSTGAHTLFENETVAARYTGSGQSIPNSTPTDIIYDNKKLDTHNSYNPISGEYEIPHNGIYSASASILYTDTNGEFNGSNEQISLSLYINGAEDFQRARRPSGAEHYASIDLTNVIFEASKGDKIKIVGKQTSGISLNMIANHAYNSFSISRIK